MNKNTKLILGGLALGAVAYWLLTKKSTTASFVDDTKAIDWNDLVKKLPFRTKSKLSTSRLAGGRTQYYTGGCAVYPGDFGTVGQIVTNWVDDPYGRGGIFVNSGTGRTIICPIGQLQTAPIQV
jgi:hypothetical protein